MNTVDFTTKNNLCISCGLCKAVCPKNCINLNNRYGLFMPFINKAECIQCGKCFKICPGKGFDYTKFLSENENCSFLFGNYKKIYTAWTRNYDRRKNSTSGGIATELIYQLLENEDYTSAFLIGTYRYNDKLCTKRYVKGDDLNNTQKSRYLPVSQEEAASYIISHRNEKVILIGTGCFVHGIMNIIETYQLNRENYFIIGLFCDKTMTLNAVRYFEHHPSLKGKKMDELHFRSKEAGNGWPGGLRIKNVLKDNIDLPRTEQMKIKDYFQPELCLYCLDKLNIFSDISVGDNYTGQHSDALGSSSIIVRTNIGEKYWNKYASCFEYYDCDVTSLAKSQKLKKRYWNYLFEKIKEKQIKGWTINIMGDLISDSTVTLKAQIVYNFKLFKISLGKQYPRKRQFMKLCFIPKSILLPLKFKMKDIRKRKKR
ncbi:MAG: hypothetical protein HDR03_07050 [Lachnospiraceae bacterium]|nr:hypothetical protein [Lachnospiraceae bacterium]